MSRPMFILNGDDGQIGVEYKNGLFPKVPNYRKNGSWFLLTEGITDDIIVDEKTTPKEIRHGQYKRLIEVSRNTLAFKHEFDSNCRETSYTFKVTIRANVYVNDPIKFLTNIQNISVRDFLNNQFSLDVKAVTRKYSILNYNGIDEELTRVLTSSVVSDETSGLSYQITTVMTEPNGEAMKILKERDDMSIKHEITTAAGEIAQWNIDKTYSEAVWEAAAKGKITDIEAIQLIEDYKRKDEQEKMERWLKLRDEGLASNEAIIGEVQKTLLHSSLQTPAIKSVDQINTDDVETLFEED